MIPFVSIIDEARNITCIHKIRAASMKKGDVYTQKKGRPGDCLIYVTNGSARYETEAREQFDMQPGSVLFLRGGVKYRVESLSDDYAYIFTEFLFQVQAQPPSNQLFTESDKEVEKLFRLLIETDVLKEPGYTIKCMSILYQIYYLLIQHNKTGQAVSFRLPQIERACYEIRQKFNDHTFRIYDVATSSGMSEVYFRKLFKEAFGLSPSQYLISLRIAHAKNLITYEKISVAEVATRSGFSDIYYFSRQFKKETGLTPTEYRRYVNSY